MTNKFVVYPALLLEALKIAGKAIDKKTVVPIVLDYLFEIKGKELKVTATDLQTSVSVTLDIENSTNDFAFVVPSETIKLLNTLKKSNVPIVITWNQETQGIELMEEDGTAKYDGLLAEDYPKVPVCEKFGFKYDTSLFRLFVDHIPYMGDDDLRPAMKVVALTINEGKMYASSTDGHKLLMTRLPELDDTDDQSRTVAMIPDKAVKLMAGFGEASLLSFYTSEDNMTMQFSFYYRKFTVEVTTRNIDEMPPNYHAIIPKPGSEKSKYTIDRPQFMKCLNKAKLFAHFTTKKVCFLLNGTNKIVAEDLDFKKEYKATIGGTLEGEPMDIAFNHELLTQVLDTFDNEDITLKLWAHNRAIVVESGSKLALLMPIQFKSD